MRKRRKNKLLMYGVIFSALLAVIYVSLYFYLGGAEYLVEAGENRIVLDEDDEHYQTRLEEIYVHPEDYQGEEIEISGLYYTSPTHPNDMFGVGRYSITCCLDHGQVIGMLVLEEFDLDGIEDEDWIVVKGEIEIDEDGGTKKPVINPGEVEKAEMPANPHIYD